MLAQSRTVMGIVALLAIAAVRAAAQDPGVSCDMVVHTIATLPSLAVVRVDTIVSDERMHRTAPGCRVRGIGLMAAFRDTGTPDEHLRTVLPTRGWVEDWDYGADGPDGTAFALRRGSTLCLFRGEWDGGDDADPSYVPSDRYALTVGCIRAAAPDSG